jgi:recombinational DNA repair ATPase RecF
MLFFLQREKQLNQEHDHLKKQIQILTEDLDKHAAELMAVRREHTNKLLVLHTELSQNTEEVKTGL